MFSPSDHDPVVFTVYYTYPPFFPLTLGQMKVPFPPTGVHACEMSDNYAVLSWTEPEPRGKEQLTFYVERVS